jgi:hypothetical protein
MRMRFLKFAALAVVAVAVFSFVVMALWNWIVPPVTGWHAITYWQALGLLILSKILFGGFRGSGRWHWRHRMMEKWEKMTPEEREKFREGMRARCGHRFTDPESPQHPA